MQKWEYKTVVRNRESKVEGRGFSSRVNTGWDLNNEALEKKCNELGDEGWELVSVEPISSDSDPYPGYTTAERWVFKRPKEEKN